MTDREKLIELLDYATQTFRFDAWENTDKIADHLLANGVTLQKWIPVSERLPEKGQNVIALGSRGGVYVAQYQGSRYWHKLNARCHMCEPTHWMPLPKPPE